MSLSSTFFFFWDPQESSIEIISAVLSLDTVDLQS